MATRPARHRNARRLDARWLITGIPTATAILHHGRNTHLQAVRSGDHPRRYTQGQHLALKAYIPGPTEANLIITSVTGPRDRYTLGQVDDPTARDLGYTNRDDFRIAWVHAEDADWLENHEGAVIDAMLARFEHRWAGKLAWLLYFTVDHTSAPRLLAATGEAGGTYVTGPDNRWHYQPREDEREADRGYTSTPSRGLTEEMPALTDAEWDQHIGPKSRHREWERLREQKQERESAPVRARLEAAKAAARTSGHNVRNELQVADHLIRRGKHDRALAQVALIEQRIFPRAA